ncbi:MAG: quinol:electron acceptor oxidoreductase subunit ActD [Bacteroidia bacterium]
MHCTGLREVSVKAHDVFSPFPIHNIDPLLDIKRTRLLIAPSFMEHSAF